MTEVRLYVFELLKFLDYNLYNLQTTRNIERNSEKAVKC